MSLSKEEPRKEYSYWKQSRDIFIKGIDKNEMLPDHAKEELKKLASEHFRVMGQLVGTVELIYLREKQHPNTSTNKT